MDRPHILFDIIPVDWENISSETISKIVVDKLHPGGIILFHDTDGDNEKGDRSNTLRSLPAIIENAKKTRI